jgi:hypothetical protein
MQKDFDTLIEALSQLEGVVILSTSSEIDIWIHFNCNVEKTITNMSIQLSDVQNIKFLSLPSGDENSYQLIMEDEQAVIAVTKKIVVLKDSKGDLKKSKTIELGIPDLSLVTLRQMTAELKQRQNLNFVLIWMEDSERDNIAIEGSNSNPTQIVGLLARGLHMAIEWAGKDIKLYKPKDDE